MIALYDTVLERVEPLRPKADAPLGLYVCGPTVYGPPHVGHGRLVLVFDILRRWLEHEGVALRHVENVTDVDDKIIDRARREQRLVSEIAEESEAQWWQAMDALGALRPHEAPHATAWIPQMIELVAQLLDRRAAYATSDGVYLDTAKVPDYGLLKHQRLEELLPGARIAVDEDKRSPFDFALWKLAKPQEPTWPAPFGAGRPGWHTECVVMALGLLGERFCLHGGGADLIFPHHENERAQAKAAGRCFARRWMHSGLVTVDGEKMSKSLGNFTTLRELLEAVEARALRLLVLRAHYRSPMEVRSELLADAERAIERLDALARRLRDLSASGAGAAVPEPVQQAAAEVRRAVAGAMANDLDTPSATAAAFQAARRANVALDEGDVVLGRALGAEALESFAAFGLRSEAGEEPPDALALELLARRDAARAARDFAAADALRAELETLGWKVEDYAGGSRLRR